MDTILDETGAKWKQLSTNQKVALAQTVAGVRQYSQFISLMDNWNEVKVNVDLALDSTGTLEEQQQIFEEGWEGASNRVSAAFEGLYAQIIDDDAVIDITNAIAKIVSNVSDLIEKAGGLKTVLLGVGSILGGLIAKNVPQMISNVTNNFKVLATNVMSFFGKTSKFKDSISTIYDDSIESITKYIADTEGTLTATENVQLTNNQKLLELKKKLYLASGSLTSEEQKSAEFLLSEIEGRSDMQVALQKRLEALQKENTLLDQQLIKEKEILATKLEQAKADEAAAQRRLGDIKTRLLDKTEKEVNKTDSSKEYAKQADENGWTSDVVKTVTNAAAEYKYSVQSGLADDFKEYRTEDGHKDSTVQDYKKDARSNNQFSELIAENKNIYVDALSEGLKILSDKANTGKAKGQFVSLEAADNLKEAASGINTLLQQAGLVGKENSRFKTIDTNDLIGEDGKHIKQSGATTAYRVADLARAQVTGHSNNTTVALESETSSLYDELKNLGSAQEIASKKSFSKNPSEKARQGKELLQSYVKKGNEIIQDYGLNVGELPVDDIKAFSDKTVETVRFFLQALSQQAEAILREGLNGSETEFMSSVEDFDAKDIVAEAAANQTVTNKEEARQKAENQYNAMGSGDSFNVGADLKSRLVKNLDALEIDISADDIQDAKSYEKALEGINKKIEEIESADGKLPIDKNEVEDLAKEIENLQNTSSGAQEALLKSNENQFNTEQARKQAEALENSLNEMTETFDNSLQHTTKLSEGIASVGSALMAGVTAFQAVQGAIQTLGDETVSFSDKLGQLAMAGGTVFPTIAQAVTSLSGLAKATNVTTAAMVKETLVRKLNTTEVTAGTVATSLKTIANEAEGKGLQSLIAKITLKTVARKIEKMADEEVTEETYAQIVANALLQSSYLVTLGIIAAVVVALAAVAIGIYAIVKAVQAHKANSPEGRLKTETAALESYTEALEDAKSKQEEFNNTLDNYNSVKDSLADMTESTLEYKQAVYEANEQALKLVELYPKLKEAMHWEGGVITFDDGAIEDAQEAQYWEVMQAQALKNNQQHRVEYTQAEVAAKEIGKNAQDKYNEDNNVSEARLNAGLAITNTVVAGVGTAMATALAPALAPAFLAGTVGFGSQVAESLSALEALPNDFSENIQNGLVTKLEESGTEGLDSLKSAIQEFTTKSQNGEELDTTTENTLKKFFTDDYATYLSDNESEISEYLEKYGEIITEGKDGFLAIAQGINFADNLSDADKKKYFGTDEETANARKNAYNQTVGAYSATAASDKLQSWKNEDGKDVSNDILVDGKVTESELKDLAKDGWLTSDSEEAKKWNTILTSEMGKNIVGGNHTESTRAETIKKVLKEQFGYTDDDFFEKSNKEIFAIFAEAFNDAKKTAATEEALSDDVKKSIAEIYKNATAEGAQAVADTISEGGDLETLVTKLGVTDSTDLWSALGLDPSSLTDEQKKAMMAAFGITENNFIEAAEKAVTAAREAVNKNWLTEQGVTVDEDASEEEVQQAYANYARDTLGWDDQKIKDNYKDIVKLVKQAKKETDDWYDSQQKIQDSIDTLEEGFEDIDDVYQEFKDGKGISGKITDSSDFGQSVISMSDQQTLDKFQQSIKDAKGDATKIQEAFDQLATDIVNSQLDKLGDNFTTEDVENLEETLKDLGITLDDTTQKAIEGAVKISEATSGEFNNLKTLMSQSGVSTEDMTNSVNSAITAFENLGYTTDEAKAAILRYYAQAIAAGSYDLSTEGSIQNLDVLCQAAGIATTNLHTLAQIMEAFDEHDYSKVLTLSTQVLGEETVNKYRKRNPTKETDFTVTGGWYYDGEGLKKELEKAAKDEIANLNSDYTQVKKAATYSGAPDTSSSSDDDSWKDDKKDYDTSSSLDDLERYIKLEHQLDRLEEAYDDVSDAVDNAFGVQRQKMYDKLAQKLKENIKLLKEEKKAAEDYLTFDANNYNSQIKDLMSNQEFAAMASTIGINLSNYLISDGLVKSIQAGTASDAEVGELQEKAANTEKYLEEILRQITNKYTYVYNNTNWSDQDTRDNWWENFEDNIQKPIEDLIDTFSSSASNLTDSIDKLIDVGDSLSEKILEVQKESFRHISDSLSDSALSLEVATEFSDWTDTFQEYFRSTGKQGEMYSLAGKITSLSALVGTEDTGNEAQTSSGENAFSDPGAARYYQQLMEGYGAVAFEPSITDEGLYSVQTVDLQQRTVLGKAFRTLREATALAETANEYGVDATGLSAEEISNLYQEATSQIKKCYEACVTAIEELATTYTEMLNDISDELSDIQSRIDFDVDGITGLGNVVKAYRKQVKNSEEAYRTLLKQSESIEINNLSSKGVLAKTYKSYYEKAAVAYDTAVEKGYEKKVIDSLKTVRDEYLKQYQEAYKDFTSSAEELATTISDNFSASIESILSDATDALDEYNDAFEKATSIGEDYLDNFNKNYELTKLISKIDTSINDTKSVKAKKALNELQAQILKKQKSSEEISEYEVEALTKQYELQLAMYELDEAKNAKSTVRLSRDAEGNLNYVYTADEDQLSEAQSNLNDKLAEYYNLNQDRVKTLQSTYLSLLSSFKDEINSLSIKDFENEAAYKAAVDNIKAYYQQKLANVEAEMGVVQTNNSEFFEQYKTALADMGISAAGQYEGMTNKAKTELDAIYQECLKQKINLVGEDGEGGLVAQVESAATESFKSLGTVISDTTTALNNLTGENGNGTQKNLGDLAKAATKLGDEFNDAANTDVAALNTQITDLLGSNSSIWSSFDKITTWSEKLSLNLSNMKQTLSDSIPLVETFTNAFEGLNNIELDTTALEIADENTLEQFMLNTMAVAVKLKKKENFTEAQWAAMDVDGNGEINMTDAQLILAADKGNLYKKDPEAWLNVAEKYAKYIDGRDYTTARTNKTGVGIIADAMMLSLSKNNSTNSSQSTNSNAIKKATPTVSELAKQGIYWADGLTSSKYLNPTTRNSDEIAKGIAAYAWLCGNNLSGYSDNQFTALGVTRKQVQKWINTYWVKGVPDGEWSWWKGTQFQDTIGGGTYSRSYVFDIANLLKAKKAFGYDTGGYTGEWGSEGRLAFLHQKEIVLNKVDTQNLLSSVEMLRNISSKLDLQALAAKFDAANFAAPAVAATTNTIPVQQDVKIEASFPNVTDSSEIEAALNNLVNEAVQYTTQLY